MRTFLKKKLYQRGLSLIEASMVLVLSAVVVAGVMVYYQTAQTNNNLDKLTSEIMHIISETNGLYAAANKSSDGTDYTGLTTDSILSAVNDTQKAQIKDNQGKLLTVIKTPFQDAGLVIGAAKKKLFGGYEINPTAKANRFMIQIAGVNVAACTKLMSINYGPQLEAIQVTNDYFGLDLDTTIDANAPISEKVKQCIDSSQGKKAWYSPTKSLFLLMK